MPYRITPFVNEEYYHVFNRGVAKMPIFFSQANYHRFTKTIIYYQHEGPKPKFSVFNPNLTKLNTKKIVDIICYCLMPNHFHFLLKQNKTKGISEFIGKLTNSYTKYINLKTNRVGPLFQGQFKAVHIENDEQLLHVSRYIHLNPVVDNLVSKIDQYRWSSYGEYINPLQGVCSKSIILEHFPTSKQYEEFLLDQEDYGRQLAILKHQLIDQT